MADTPESFPYHFSPTCKVCAGLAPEDLLRLNHDIMAGHTTEQLMDSFKHLYTGKGTLDRKTLEAHIEHVRSAEATKCIDAPDTFEAFETPEKATLPAATPPSAKAAITTALNSAARLDAPIDEYELLKVLAKDSLSDLATLNDAMEKYSTSVKMTSSLARTKNELRNTSMSTLTKILEMKTKQYGEMMIAQKVLDVLQATMKCMVKAFKKEKVDQDTVNRFRDTLQAEMLDSPIISPYLHDRV